MARRLFVLLLGAGLALAQEGEDDEGISIDEKPSGPEAPTTPAPAREPGKRVGTATIKSKVYSLAVPADWVLVAEDVPGAELAWELLLPGSTKRATLKLLRDEKGDARSSPYYQAQWTLKDSPGAKTEVRKEPCPRLVVRRPWNATDWTDAYFYRSIRNNQYVFLLSCAASDFPEAETDMLDAVASFAAEVESRPPIPKGYAVSQEETWLIARAPAVTASIAPIVKTLKEQEKRFERDHGPLPRSDAPLVVLVHASKSAAGKIEPRAAESNFDFTSDTWNRRLFAVPFAKEDVRREALLAYEAQDLLLFARYGDVRPGWIWVGECIVAQAEVHTGKPLPSLDQGYVAWASTLQLHLIGGLERLADVDAEAWFRECFFYVAALREGRYKKAYRAFLEECAETSDCMGAFERHLGKIDQEDLRTSTKDFISKEIKEVKRKEEKPKK